MKLLFTGDWQVAPDNLHLCKIVVEQLLKVCASEKIDAIIHTGDVKDHYDPVSIRVVNFMVRSIKKFNKAGVKFYVLLGNHDRIGMSDESGSWFPTLRAAGAITIDKPGVVALNEKNSLYCVPYLNDSDELVKTYQTVVSKSTDNDILIFHHDVRGCRVNALSKSEGGVPPSVFGYGAFRFGIGGHIHMAQTLKAYSNVGFIGSPFPVDWGEVNQRKGYLLLDTETWERKAIVSKCPLRYDPSWPGFDEVKPKSWKGTMVRVHAPCDASVANIKALLELYKEQALKQYPGATIHVVPETADGEASDVSEVASQGSDEAAIRAYVKATVPPGLSAHVDNIVAYILDKLAAVGGARRANQVVKLLSCEAENFLSFKQVKFKFNRPGITVIRGVNEDWKGCSNGSGKTSLLQLPLAAMFGKTLKGQTFDRWVRRGSGKAPAFVNQKLELANGRRMTVVRPRRPNTRLRVLVDNKDHSSGLGSKGTQKLIEKLSGLTWESMTSAVYVDQSEISAILKGHDSERKAIFSRILNLDRFNLAKELVKDECRALDKAKLEASEDSKATHEVVENLEETLKHFEVSKTAIEGRGVALRGAKKALKHQKAVHRKLQVRVEKADAAKRTAIKDGSKLAVLNSKVDRLTDKAAKYKYLVTTLENQPDVCPKCGQKINKANVELDLAKHKAALLRYMVLLEQARRKVEARRNKIDELEEELRESRHELTRCEDKLFALEATVRDLNKLYEDEKQQRQKWLKSKAKVRRLKERLKRTNRYMKWLDFEDGYLQYCAKVVSKDGVPAYLIQQLCPRINQASEFYSQVFTNGHINVEFKLRDEDIDIDVSNAHGGESLDDQSRGETRFVSIITSFALRDVVNPCNILVLDEPGDGLDEVNAKAFAAGLKQVAGRLGSVFITTHNPFILSALEGERCVTVTKKHKVSSVSGNI